MKVISANVVLRALLVLVGFVTLSGYALCSGSVSFKPLTDEGKVLVSLEDVQADLVSLSIEDKNENVVYYSSTISGDELYKKVYDVSNLADGTYYLIANFGSSKVKKEFVVSDSKVVYSNTNDEIACKPIFRQDGDLLYVMYQCPVNNPVEVDFKEDSETFYSHNIDKSRLAAKYDLSYLPNGDYSVVLNTGDNKFTYNFKVK